ncbi:MAG TPA: TonB-dependent receptor [Longimicrobiales bacterium]|nr:TonB-dependent receptor [Longimicrobiales bacterium]
MRFLLLAGLFLLAASPVRAQDATLIRGTVRAADTQRPLPIADVVIRSAADTTQVVATARTLPNGMFRVAGAPAGTYLVQALFVGYSPASQRITLAAGDTVDVGVLELPVSAIALEGVTVATERAPATFAPDRTIYSTQDMPVASGGVATEVLRSIPELEVDIDGAVQLRGSSPEIYLNGRPAPMQGEALSVFLQQFPADRIERVEVIPSPSARYDAEGAGGIVNIVLKEDVDLGLSGSVFANAGTRGEVGGGGRLAMQRGPLTLFGGAFARYSNNDDTSFDLRKNLVTTPETFLRQDSHNESEGLSGSVDLTAEYELTDNSLLWVEGRVSRFGFDRDAVTTTTQMDADSVPTQQYTRTSIRDSRRSNARGTLGFRWAPDPRNHELSIELEADRGGNDQDDDVETLLELADPDAPITPADLTLLTLEEAERELSARLDYTRPLGEEGQLEIGVRSELETLDEERLLELIDDGTADVSQTGFEHRELFNSIYGTVTRRFGRFGAQVGLRAERADTRFTLPDGESFENDYASLFPSANISYELSEGTQARLSYTRRIRRPRSHILNPIDDSTDPLNRTIGNPYIEPQYTNSFSLDLSRTARWGTLRLSPYYRSTENDWAQIKTVDADGVSTVTWENVASQESYGASLTASLRPIGGWGGFASLSMNREDRDASNLAATYSGTSTRMSVRANINGALTSTLSAQMMVSYTPARDVPQGRIGARTMMHMGLRQRFFDGKGSINVSVMDPFDLWNSEFVTRDPTHVQIGRSEFSMRRATIGISWAFGRQPESERNRQMEEEDVAPEPVIR